MTLPKIYDASAESNLGTASLEMAKARMIQK
jgi:hypothetical protein